MGFLDKMFGRATVEQPKQEQAPVQPKLTLEQLREQAQTDADRLRLDMFEKVRELGVQVQVDSGVAIGIKVDTDEERDAIIGVFERDGYPRGELRKSNDGSSLEEEFVNWEEPPNAGFIVVRTILRPEHRRPSNNRFYLVTLTTSQPE